MFSDEASHSIHSARERILLRQQIRSLRASVSLWRGLAVITWAITIAVFASGCGPAADCTSAAGILVYGVNDCAAFQAAENHALDQLTSVKDCDEAQTCDHLAWGRDDLRQAWQGWRLVVVDHPLKVDGKTAWGITDYTERLITVTAFPTWEHSALTHELAHVASRALDSVDYAARPLDCDPTGGAAVWCNARHAWWNTRGIYRAAMHADGMEPMQ